MADGGGHRRHVAERRGVVQHGGAAEGLGGGLAGGGALEAVDRRDVQLVGAVAVGHLLGRDLDLLLGFRVHFDHAVQPDFDAWQEVAVVGEGAGRAGVTEHRADHGEVCGAATAAGASLRALALRTGKKTGEQHQNLQRKRQSWPLHGAAPPHLHTELM
uniref:Uncharacterized protein n=1 Tax=Arundo donax TaxID=35708 RepID=A0A0A9GM75_ARUDO